MEQYHLPYTVQEEKRIRIFGPLLFTIFLLLLLSSIPVEKPIIEVQLIIISLFYSILNWESGRWLILHCRNRMPEIRNVKKRIRFVFLFGIPLSAGVGLIDRLFSIWPGQYQDLVFDDFLFLSILNILCLAVAVIIYESQYFLQEWKILISESENLKKHNSNTQFQFLREQIKPHFLFNSLNTLSALISADPVKAELYVEEMSTVYRYFLTTNENILTTLKEELSFLDSYLLLLKVRFEKAFFVTISTQEKLREHLLPPFVLQLLIENAVKHNIISGDHPLSIKIYTDNQGILHVENNLNLKERRENSEHIGLANIRLRYALLNREGEFRVSMENHVFKVSLPLLKETQFKVAHLLTV